MPNLDALLAPQSIAIIGASPDVASIRGKVQHVLQQRGYPGRVYPVSRSHVEVQSAKAYRSIAEVPEAVDLAIIIIPAAAVPQALEDCGKAGVRAAYIISSGFAEESGEAGAALQARILDLARHYDMAVCGPNAEGFFNAPANVVATFSPAVEDFSTPMAPETTLGKRLAVVAQSGGIGFSYYHRGRPKQLRFDLALSTGNEVALTSFDFVEHIIERDLADIIVMYSESVKSPAAFRRVAAKAADAGKPLVIAQMGRSDVSRRAAASHTAALAGADSTYDALFRRYGVTRVDDIDQQLDIAAAMAFCPLPKGKRVAVMTGSGGAAVWMSELLAAQGLELPLLDEATRQQIEALLPSYGSAANPVDLTAGTIRHVGYARIVEILQGSPVIDAVVIVGSLANARRLEEDRALLAKVALHPHKPVFFCAYTLASQAAVDLAAQVGVPVFTSMANCARAMRALVDYAAFQQRWRQRAPDPVSQPQPAVREALRKAGKVLCEYQAKAVLAAYGVAGPPEVLALNADDAVAAAAVIGFPVALKIQSPDIPHKTEMGGVLLNLRSAEDVRAAHVAMLDRAHGAHPDADVHGVLVQRMAARGREVILGVSRDHDFGPMLMVGLGGIHVEVLRDVAFAPLPLSRDDALALLQQLKGTKLLEAVRGEPAADVGALAELMVALGRFAIDFADQVTEIDLNPVLVHAEGQGVSVVDALILR